MSDHDLFFVDAFASEPFQGNPAAVCLLGLSPRHRRGPEWMQALASELRLSETAFLLGRADGTYDLRWFTPTTEVALCGHATLASSHCLWETGRLAAGEPARFHTKSGVLRAERAGEEIALDLPAAPVEAAQAPEGMLVALGVEPRFVGRTTGPAECNYLVEVADEEAVRAARPDFARLGLVRGAGVILTAAAAGNGRADFVSRYFAPAFGVDEDPVTGAAHCALGPFWCARLEREELVGYQASERGGYVRVRPAGERVRVAGRAVTVLRGRLA